jgi:hypothetical protein
MNEKMKEKGEKIDISKMTKEEEIAYLKAKVDYLNQLYKQPHGHYP